MPFLRSLDNNSENAGFTRQIYQSSVVVIILAVGVTLSIAAFFQVQEMEQLKVQKLFEISAHNRLAAFHSDIVRHREVVSSIASLFAASQDVTREEFGAFVQNQLSTHPDIQALGWNPLIKYSERQLFEVNTQEEGFNNFHITEVDHNNQQQRAAMRDDYIPVHYLEPYIGNEEAHGFDVASHPGRLAAIIKARDTGQPIITERVRLVQEKEEKFGYLLFKAVYRKGTNPTTISERRSNFIGVATGVFRFSESIHFTMRNFPPLGVDVRISDLSASPGKQFLYFHASRTRETVFLPTPVNLKKAEKGLHLNATIEVLGRKWSFLFTPAPAFLKAHQYWQSWAALGIGLLLTVFLSFYFLSKIRHVARLASANIKLNRQIKDRKQAEEALQDLEETQRLTLSNISDAIFITDDDGNLVYISPYVNVIFGYSAEEVLELGNIERLLGRAIFDQQELDQVGEIHNIEIQIKDKNDNKHVLLIHVKKVIIKKGTLLYTCRDITERTQAENALIESEDALSKSEETILAIIDTSKDWIWSIDLQGIHTFSNPAIEEILGFTPEEIIGSNYLDLILDEDRKRVEGFLRESIEKQQGWNNIIIRWRHKDGGYRSLESNAVPQVDSEGKLLGFRGVDRDITLREKQASKLRKLSQAIHSAGEAVMITDNKSVIEYVNPAFSVITGYSEEEVIGKTPAILKSSAQDQRIYDELLQTISSGNVWHGSLIDKKKDGTFYPALSSIAPICDQDDQITHYVSLQQDMTEYRKLEEQFIQAQKMESIGVLVGGIAHDFNNMLSGILGNAYLAKSDTADNPKLLNRLETINTLGERGANMIKQLLAFARKDVLTKKFFSLTKFSKEAVKLAMTAIPENIEQRLDLTEDELVVFGDATQLQQVLMNLINNAKDALEGTKEGKITLTLKECTPDSSFKQNYPNLKEDKYACLTLSDNGMGMSEEVIDKVFDPFFTTKGVGKGTGLGLSMVFGTIEKHNGAIDLVSSPGKGTTFKIYLPIVSDEIEQNKSDLKDIVTGEKELILIVDDERLLLVLAEELLQSFGYRVIIAHNGQEAIQKFEQYKNEISLVILDVVMPILGGVDAAREIRRVNDQIPIIFTTGYDKDTALRDIIDQSNCHVLTKPYSAEKLSQVIKMSLD